MTKKFWTVQQDCILGKMVKADSKKNWKQISKQFNKYFGKKITRTDAQCRERWSKYLSPKVTSTPISQNEMQSIFKLHKVYKNKWCDIATKHFEIYNNKRIDNDIKNKFNNTIRKAIRMIYRELGHQDSTNRVKKLKSQMIIKLMDSFSEQANMHSQIQDIYGFLFDISIPKRMLKLKNQLGQQRYRQILHIILQKVASLIQNQEQSNFLVEGQESYNFQLNSEIIESYKIKKQAIQNDGLILVSQHKSEELEQKVNQNTFIYQACSQSLFNIFSFQNEKFEGPQSEMQQQYYKLSPQAQNCSQNQQEPESIFSNYQSNNQSQPYILDQSKLFSCDPFPCFEEDNRFK